MNTSKIKFDVSSSREALGDMFAPSKTSVNLNITKAKTIVHKSAKEGLNYRKLQVRGKEGEGLNEF